MSTTTPADNHPHTFAKPEVPILTPSAGTSPQVCLGVPENWNKTPESQLNSICFIHGIFGASSCTSLGKWGKWTRWWQLKYFCMFTPPREMIQFDEHIFQLGWLNHQLEYDKNRKPLVSDYGPAVMALFCYVLCGSWFQTPHNSTWEVKLNMHMCILLYTYNMYIFTYHIPMSSDMFLFSALSEIYALWMKLGFFLIPSVFLFFHVFMYFSTFVHPP